MGEKGSPLQKFGEEPFTFSGLPPEGVDLTVKVRASGPVRFTVVDQTNGLSRIPGVMLPSRLKTVMPAPQPEQFQGYTTFERKSFVFGEGQTP